MALFATLRRTVAKLILEATSTSASFSSAARNANDIDVRLFRSTIKPLVPSTIHSSAHDVFVWIGNAPQARASNIEVLIASDSEMPM